MTRAGRRALLHLLGPLCLAGAALAQAFDVPRLQRLLQQAPDVELRFTEVRESRWLAAPVESSGTLRSNATMLEKRVEKPRRETWRILGDRIQLGVPGSNEVKEIPLDAAPAAAALARALRHVVAGELDALKTDFELELSGDEREWALQLTPRQPAVARQLQRISLRGAGRRLAVIEILEAQGDRTTTRLSHPE